ncbi:monocarboxylate transporter 12-like [Glandiceps talaboti]
MSHHPRRQHKEGPDGGWGWMVVMATSIVQSTLGGLPQCLSPLFIALRRYFQSSAEATSWILSLLTFCSCMTQVIGSLVTKRVGHRVTVVIGGVLCSLGFFISYFATSLYFLYGSISILSGIGIAVATPPAHAMTALYFPKKYPLANSIVFLGPGLIIVLLTPLLQFFVDTYGWRGCVFILSAITANNCVAGTLLRPLKSRLPEHSENTDENGEAKEENTNTHRANSNTGFSLLICLQYAFVTNIQFSLIVLSYMFTFIALFGGIVHFQSYAVSKNTASVQQAAWLVSIFGATSLISRIGVGISVQFKLLSAISTYILSLLIVGTAFVIPQLTNSYAGFIVISVIFGLASGTYLTLIMVLAKEYLGSNKMIYAVPILHVGIGIGNLVGPPFVGFVYDVTGIYDYSFYLVGCSHLLAGIICLPCLYITWSRKKAARKETPLDLPVGEDHLPDAICMVNQAVQTTCGDGEENVGDANLDSPYI